MTELRKGDRIGVSLLHSTCSACEYCTRGRENLCPSALFTGYDVDGGYAEYYVVPKAFAYPLPEGLSDIEAAPLLCAGITGFRSFRLAGVGRGDRLGLFDFGSSAHIVAQVALHEGCEIYAFSRGEARSRLALKLGAAWVGRPDDEPPERLTPR